VNPTKLALTRAGLESKTCAVNVAWFAQKAVFHSEATIQLGPVALQAHGVRFAAGP
jgi:hypothetical protein